MRLPILQVSLDTRKLASFAFIAFLVGGALGGVLFNYGGVYVPTSDLSNMFGYMQQFQSFNELKAYLNEIDSGEIYWGMPFMSRGLGVDFIAVEDSSMESFAPADSSMQLAGPDGGATDYSGTNIQVEGVDEADIVKTDGQFIYFAKGT